MSLISLGSYLSTLKQLRLAQESVFGTSTEDGWSVPRTVKRIVQSGNPDGTPRRLRHDGGSKTLFSTQISDEVITDASNTQGQNGLSDGVFYTDGVGHHLCQELDTVHELLMLAWQKIRDPKDQDLNNYMLHVNDMVYSSANTRPTSNNYSYLGSQLSIITPDGRVISFTMDRCLVNNGVGASTKFVWCALVIPEDTELAIVKHIDARRVSIQASGYIDQQNCRIAYFEKTFKEYCNDRVMIHEYVHRKREMRDVIPLVRGQSNIQQRGRTLGSLV